MSEALNNILEVLKIEAETQVRTEYENTVVSLRSIVKGLEDDLRIANGERDSFKALAKKHEDRLIRTKEALNKVLGTL